MRPGAVGAVAQAAHLLADAVGSRDAAFATAARLLAAWQTGGAPALDAATEPLETEAVLAYRSLLACVREVPRSHALDAVDATHEALLADLESDARTRRGAFFTPAPLARFVVNAAIEIIAREGWDAPRVVIDPAAGAGVFLALAGAHPRFATQARLVAHEIHPLTAGVLRARFAGDARVTVRETDTLADTAPWSERDETLIVLGNPPFSGRSASNSAIASGLLRGIDPLTNDARQSYSHIDGVALGERNPKWIQDDCVKFIRFAQWQLERAARGVVALVCTHAFLHHPTFRAMRHSLWSAHDGVHVLDLHGNTKKLERSPDGERDQNVFEVQQGVAVLLFWRGDSPRGGRAPVRFAELWGSRESKHARLASASIDSLAWSDVHPTAPRFAFTPEDDTLRSEYHRGLSIAAIFSVASPGIVTGRDALLVAPSRETLLARLDAMRDPSLDDATFAATYLRRRDALDLASARSAMRANADAASTIAPCLYRPFDIRYLLDLDPWIERPRRPAMSALRTGDPAQIALIARRQSPPGRDAPFVFVTTLPAADGVIRSDNHGSESVFPLFALGPDGALVPALTAIALDAFVQRVGATSPPAVFAYLYALLHAPSYRTRYANFLRQDLPRVALPPSRGFFDRLVALGEALIAAHTLDATIDARTIERPPAPAVVHRPVFANDTIRIGPDAFFRPVSEAAWHLAVGGYQPLRKWLDDRRGETLDALALEHYARMIVAAEQTLIAIHAIDGAIADAGGLPFA